MAKTWAEQLEELKKQKKKKKTRVIRVPRTNPDWDDSYLVTTNQEEE